MKTLRILVRGTAIVGLLAMAMPAHGTDAREISDELFGELDAVIDVELLNDFAFDEFRLAQAEMNVESKEFERSRAERNEEMERARAEMAGAREKMEEAAREMARLGQEIASEVVIRIHERQPKAMLGINLESRDGKEAGGVKVAGVSSDGPAEKAGLQAGDILVEIDGNSLKGDDDDSSISKLTGYMADVEPGQKVKVDYLRAGKPHSVVIETTEFSFPNFSNFAFDFDFSDMAESLKDLKNLGEHRRFEFVIPGGAVAPHMPRGPRQLYAFGGHRIHGALGDMEMVSLTPELGEYFGTKKGLLVVRAPKNEDIDLQDGDVILKIGDREPSSPGQLFRIIGSYEAGETVELQVMRKKKKRKLEITLPENDREIRIWKGSNDASIHQDVIIRKPKTQPSTGT
ncbi:MAG: PDZ domain-containing protein [Gammaproteobacteria bacterium]|nr:PDZ domain-containing protein [Gammaproteobacteria bacterium]MCZ6687597.1 PDZ domain-containing protein [Gammaproteobacteria bacterium]MCZ6880457.1 PDZ domain-containing protein [Gammaproteobacteria bacterium]